jgi:hypothetical protein
MTWNIVEGGRKGSSRGSFGPGERQTTAVCLRWDPLSSSSTDQPMPDGRERAGCVTPGGDNVVGISVDILVLCAVSQRWVIGGREIDEVHPGQSETIGSGLISGAGLAPPGMAPI